MKIPYTEDEIKNIEKAYYSLSRIFESSFEAENALHSAFKYEYHLRRNAWNAQALIIRAVYERNKIQKHNLFTFSEGIMICIIAALHIFHNPTKFGEEKINDFNKIAKKAIKSHDACIQRGFDAIC